MHRTDLFYRLPSLPTESLIQLEQSYRTADETRECRSHFNYNRAMWIRASMELFNRKNKKEPANDN